jgi:hypothetical protein
MLNTGIRCVTRLMIVGAVLLTQIMSAEAQTGKFTGSGKVIALLAETRMQPGDKQGHELTMARRLDTITYSDPVLGTGQATVVALSDYVAGSGLHRGYFAIKHPNGDSTFTSYEGATKATPRAGGPPDVMFEGTWQYLGGTGKFDGISGGGTYKGGVTPAGVGYELEGRYTLKQ